MSEACGCPGSRMEQFEKKADVAAEGGKRVSQLAQWPVQLHLVSPLAPYFQGADLLLSADCVAYALADFHKDYLKGRSLAIACPKLDDGQDTYVDKLVALIDEARVNSITLMIMQVPCCRGLLSILQQAQQRAKREVPVKLMVVSLQGEILSEDWV
jgi:hypothetical protein